VGIGLALLWPYFPVVEAVGAHGGFQQAGFSGDYRTFYDGAFLVLLPAIAGILHVVDRARRRRLDFVSWGMGLFLAIYLVNLWTLRSGPVARLVAFVALFLQLGVLLLLAAAASGDRSLRVVTAVVLVALAVAGVGQVWNARRWIGVEPFTSGTTALDQFARYRPYGEFLDRDDVVLSDPVSSWILPPVVGTTVVAVLHANPFFLHHDRRLRDVERFLRTDREGMLGILERYGVTHLLLPREALPYLAPIRADLRQGHADESFVLLRYEP
jgi:hypothetical protein